MNLRVDLTITCLLAGLFIFSIPRLSASSEHGRVTVKAKVGVEYDDNVFEEIEDRTGGLAARCYLGLNSTLFRSKRVLTSLRYQGALKRPLRSPSGDSLSAAEPIVHSLTLSHGHKLTERLVAAIEGEIKSRTLMNKGSKFLPSQDGYLQGAAGLSLKVRLAGDLAGTFSYRRSFVHFGEFRDFDFRAQEAGIHLNKRLFRRLTCRLGGSWKRLNFDRHALTQGLQRAEDRQKDTVQRIGVHFKFYRLFLIDGGYCFLRNTSNSYGYAFDAHRLTLVLGKMLTRRIGLQLYGVFQRKNYTEDIRDVPFISPPKDMEGSVFVVKGSGDITDRWGIEVQYGLHREESLQRNRFHTRSLYSSSLSLRF